MEIFIHKVISYLEKYHKTSKIRYINVLTILVCSGEINDYYQTGGSYRSCLLSYGLKRLVDGNVITIVDDKITLLLEAEIDKTTKQLLKLICGIVPNTVDTRCNNYITVYSKFVSGYEAQAKINPEIEEVLTKILHELRKKIQLLVSSSYS